MNCDIRCTGPTPKGVSYIGQANRAWTKLVQGWVVEQCPGCQLWTIWIAPEGPREKQAKEFATEHSPLPEDWEEEAEYYGKAHFEAMEAFRAGWDAREAQA